MKIVRLEGKEALKKLIQEKIEQLNLFGDTEATKRAEKKEQDKQKRKKAAEKAAETRQKNKEKKEKEFEKDFNTARSVGVDLFGNKVTDEEREEAKKRLKQKTAKKK